MNSEDTRNKESLGGDKGYMEHFGGEPVAERPPESPRKIMAGQHTECVSFESWNRARKMNSCC
jgi:hypothetical protein